MRLEQQREAIDKAVSILRSFDEGATEEATATTKRVGAKKAKKKRVMSEEARQRIADRVRPRWAKVRKAKKAAKKGV